MRCSDCTSSWRPRLVTSPSSPPPPPAVHQRGADGQPHCLWLQRAGGAGMRHCGASGEGAVAHGWACLSAPTHSCGLTRCPVKLSPEPGQHVHEQRGWQPGQGHPDGALRRVRRTAGGGTVSAQAPHTGLPSSPPLPRPLQVLKEFSGLVHELSEVAGVKVLADEGPAAAACTPPATPYPAATCTS